MLLGVLRRKTLSLLLLVLVSFPASSCGTLDRAMTERPELDFRRESVVLLHGLGRSQIAMQPLACRLEEAGFQVISLGYSSLRKGPEEILADITAELEELRIEKLERVHFVGHSLGGLLIRAYLTNHDLPNLGRVVLLGTPNAGAEVVDNLQEEWWFGILGPTAEALGTGEGSFPRSIGPPDYPLGVIAGFTDQSNEDYLPGPDDGLVTVASTKVSGMADFVVVETNHANMRRSEEVARHIQSFLKTGRFGEKFAKRPPALPAASEDAGRNPRGR